MAVLLSKGFSEPLYLFTKAMMFWERDEMREEGEMEGEEERNGKGGKEEKE